MGNDYEYVGAELDLFARASRWKAYVRKELRPYIHKDVLEVGAGIGATTQALCVGDEHSWTCLEPDEILAKRLLTSLQDGSFASRLDPTVIVGTISDIPANDRYDTILYIDVLEHIENDASELKASAALLRDKGYLVVLAPAHQWLYSPFDKAIGHYRRYNRASLRTIVPDYLRPIRLRYLDSVGLLASMGNRFTLRSRMPSPGQLAAWDHLMVPCSRVVDPLLNHSLGKTVIGIWRRLE